MLTPGAQVSKSMHPAAKMCTLGQGAPLISNTASVQGCQPFNNNFNNVVTILCVCLGNIIRDENNQGPTGVKIARNPGGLWPLKHRLGPQIFCPGARLAPEQN